MLRIRIPWIWIHHIMSSLVALLCVLLPSAAAASQPALSCSGTLHPSGSASYQLSKPPPSTRCETYWEDRDKTVLARDSDFDPKFVQHLTNQSITLSTCRDVLTYRVDCPPVGIDWEEVQCGVNCSMTPQPSSAPSDKLTCIHPWCLETQTFGLVFGVPAAFIILALVFGVAVFILRRRRSRVERSSTTYSAVDNGIKMEGGQADHIQNV